ncbi:adenosylcobalamin-dependent ribonucleoside-diphosphate reductase [Candidatus Woesearchaeota archaeon]|nr:MAG: adenosylcobalamin-dependent ribonucleoside-diphosphate reductase [Candidatus Woesearchaeota archaeon]
MVRITQIRKRDGTLAPFDRSKIEEAIKKAILAAKGNPKLAPKLAAQVCEDAEKHFSKKVIPKVEDIQDLVEEILIKNKLATIAKAYVLYREKHKEIREFKTFLGVRDELKLSPNALRVLAGRYLLRDDKGAITETPSRLFRRVAKAVAAADTLYTKGTARKTEEEFFRILSSLEFIPNSPTLMNAGTPLGQLSACFVLPIEDSLSSIFDTLKNAALIHQSGGGTGFSFSKLRPRGDLVKSTKGTASGPVSFLSIYDTATDVIKQGSKRRGANIGILRFDHPDILEFITSKTEQGKLANFNISIAATDAFIEAAQKKKDIALINPRTGKTAKMMNAHDLLALITSTAWKTGDPGLIFIDEINRKNPTASLGQIESTNPCGEQPLHPNESCTLGSINLAAHALSGKIDWTKLKQTIHTAIHFLDNVIDINHYPLPETEHISKQNRRIGLGVMGFAELLITLGLPYDSPAALKLTDKLAKFIADEARKASNKLGETRGAFPNFARSTLAKTTKTTRNATVTTIAPTGTISIIANVTSGIEPLFAVSYVRNILAGAHLLETNTLFEHIARKRGFHSKSLMMKIARTGSVQKIKEVPKDLQKLFKTAHEITPEAHVKMQAAWQKHCDNAVSKTVNLPESATPEDIRKTYLLAHKLKCKGITVYRYGSKPAQVLTFGKKPDDLSFAEPEYSGGHLCSECTY